MVSPFSPPVLYLSDDDDDDNELEQNISYGSSLTSMHNDNLPRKKRKLTNTNVRINPTVVNWSKRQRNDHFQHQHQHHHQQTTYNSFYPDPELIAINPDEYNHRNQQSHSFHAFDWTSEPRTAPRIYSNPIQTNSRMSMIPSNVMNVVKHHLDQSDTVPIIPLHHQNDRYVQHPQRKSISIPRSASPPPPPPPPPPLPLPLPKLTSSLVRPHAQRIQPGKNVRIPYTHSTPPPPPPPPPLPPPPPPLLPVHHPVKQSFARSTYRPTSPASIPIPISTLEILRQPLNGTGILSAFYDSKCYRCNICKFKSVTSSTLLQHLFTHIFFCHQCSFYSYSHHSLYQHIFEKHNSNNHKDNIDPKHLDLVYITRCSDGTFALCMDSSPPPLSAPPPPPPLPPPTTKIIEKPITAPNKNTKPKTPKKKPPKPKKEQDNDVVILSEKRDINPQPSSSSSSTTSIIKRPIPTKKLTNTFILMKHRRCYSIRLPPCLHSLTLEYNICREHTIRHMCQTQKVLKRRNFKLNSKTLLLIDEVATCLKTIVNNVIDIEENRNSSDLVCTLPNNILNSIFEIDDMNTITNLLKLNNKYEKSIEQNQQNQSEYSVRASIQHTFILFPSGINKNEQSIFASLNTSITNVDSPFTQTKLNKLPITYDNTHRFLKGNLNIPPRTTNSITETLKKTDIIPGSKNPELIFNNTAKPLRYANRTSTSPIVDNNNNSVTSSKSRLSPTPSVIVID